MPPRQAILPASVALADAVRGNSSTGELRLLPVLREALGRYFRTELAGYPLRDRLVELAELAASLAVSCLPVRVLLALFEASRWLCTAWHNTVVTTVCSELQHCIIVGQYFFDRGKEAYSEFHRLASVRSAAAAPEWHSVVRDAQGFVERQMTDLLGLDQLGRATIRRHLCGPIGIGLPVLDVNAEKRDRWRRLAVARLGQLGAGGGGGVQWTNGTLPLPAARLAFVFLTYASLAHERAWAAFFGDVQGDRYSIWMHSLRGHLPTSPFFRSHARMVTSAEKSSWCGIGSLMLDMMSRVLATDAAAIVWLAQDTLPLRSFLDVYSWALADTRSAFCMNGGTGCADTWSVMQRRHIDVFANYRSEFVQMFDGIATCQEECWFSLGLLLADPGGLRYDCGTYTCWEQSKPLSARMAVLVPSMAGLNRRPADDCGGPQEFAELRDSDFQALLASGLLFARKFPGDARLVPSGRDLQTAVAELLRPRPLPR